MQFNDKSRYIWKSVFAITRLFYHKARHNCAETEKHVVSLMTEWFTSKKNEIPEKLCQKLDQLNLIIKCYNKHHKDHNLDNSENLCHWHLKGFLSWIVMTIRLVRVFLFQEFKGKKPFLVAKKYLHCSTTSLFNNKLPKKMPKIFHLTGLSFRPTSTARDLGTL